MERERRKRGERIRYLGEWEEQEGRSPAEYTFAVFVKKG